MTEEGVWLGFKRCGCLVAVCKEIGAANLREHNDAVKLEWLNDGLTVEWRSRQEWDDTYRAAFLIDCPHKSPAVEHPCYRCKKPTTLGTAWCQACLDEAAEHKRKYPPRKKPRAIYPRRSASS